MEERYRAITKSHSHTEYVLCSAITICYHGREFQTQALWDTGATRTCISYKVRDDLELVSEGTTHVTSSSDRTEQQLYTVDIALPDNILFKDLMVVDSNLNDPRYECVIGMDIITKGDLTISNFQGLTVLTFRTPSQARTDYVREYVDSVTKQPVTQ